MAFFELRGMSGDMAQFSTNVPNYSGKSTSFVITPPGVATIYTQINYEGKATCVKPENGTQTHWTYDITAALGIGPSQIKSMKFGCDSSNIHYSSTKY